MKHDLAMPSCLYFVAAVCFYPILKLLKNNFISNEIILIFGHIIKYIPDGTYQTICVGDHKRVYATYKV